MGHVALTSLDGPWASVARFVGVGLHLFLIEPQASDLVFFIENAPHLVLTVDEPATALEGERRRSIQLFGKARILTPHELDQSPEEVQQAYALRSQDAPGVYAIIEVRPRCIFRVIHDNNVTLWDTLDLE